ncbi:MAG: hypothetical protein KZQ83_07270 [gamma proteobacterium symbiont of Taylorina sp.]|nr:hypothetical protein [gamma proteobacterium symbiont of Taylorina sp.]
MCSTPRYSGSTRTIGSTMPLHAGQTHFKSYSLVMRNASEIYDQNKEERAKIRKKRALEKKQHLATAKMDKTSQSNTELCDFHDGDVNLVEKNSPIVENSLKQRIKNFISFLRFEIPSIMMIKKVGSY